MVSLKSRSEEEFRRLHVAREMLADVNHAHLSINDAAREASLSTFHFIRRFRAVFGETPHQFRIRERLTVARALLARGHSVTDVCMNVGFSSVGSFSTLFSRTVGLSPLAYQRQLRCAVYMPQWMPQWTPHPPSCLLLMGGPAAFAIFEKTSTAY